MILHSVPKPTTLHGRSSTASRCSFRRCSRHIGPHRVSRYSKGETDTQRPPRSVYVHPLPSVTRIGFITDTMPAPIQQRTILFYWQWKFRRNSRVNGKGRRTHAVIEDPWLGIKSTNRVWIAFITVMTDMPTARGGGTLVCVAQVPETKLTEDLQDQRNGDSGPRFEGPTVTNDRGSIDKNYEW